MAHHKSKPEGRAERLELLRTVFADVDGHVERKTQARSVTTFSTPIAAAWTARRWAARTHRQLGGDIDERGLRMEIIV